MKNKTIFDIKEGDRIKIDADAVVKEYLSSHLFSGINIDLLRACCSFEKNKFYKIVSVCKPCKAVKINSGNWNVKINYKFIIEIK